MNRNINILMTVFLVLMFAVNSHAQLKRDSGNPNISSILSTSNGDFLLGFLDPSKIHMHHSFSTSYSAFGSQGMMLSSYLNTIDFQLSENWLLQTNLGLINSPYNTFGENFYLNDTKFFGGAKLKYRINDQSSVQLQFDYSPYYYYPTLGSYRYNHFDE